MTEMVTSREAGRLFYLDILRIVAILGVAAIHNWSLLHVLTPGTRAWWAIDVFFTVGRWAVPCFVMISGGLLLRPRRVESATDFYRRRLWRIGIPSVVWIAAYFVFRATVLDQDITRRTVVTDLALAQPFTHLYFVYVIVGLYLITPVLRAFTASHGRRPVAVAAAALLGMWSIEAVLPYAIGSGSRVTGLTYWVPFLGYYLAGSALFGLRMSQRTVWLVFAGVVSVILLQIGATYLFTILSGGTWTNYAVSYWSPFTIAAALGIYALAAREAEGQHRAGRIGFVAQRLGEATFGVFLVHEMLLYLHAINFVHGPPEALVTARIPTYVIAIVGSFAIVLAVKRIPLLRSIF